MRREIELKIQQLPTALAKMGESEKKAVWKAVLRTAQVDAHRRIQHAIRQGGPVSESAVRPKPPTKTGKSKKTKKKTTVRKPPKYRVPIDTGDYANSWRAEVVEDGTSIFLYPASSPALKAGVIENGRRAAYIPIAPLADWVRRKLGVSDDKEARGIAFAISASASVNPRPGLKVLARAHPEIAKDLQRNLAQYLLKARAGGKAKTEGEAP